MTVSKTHRHSKGKSTWILRTTAILSWDCLLLYLLILLCALEIASCGVKSRLKQIWLELIFLDLVSEECTYLNGNYPERMERGTPQRKTVYRISLTLVKKETLQDGGGSAHRRLENPKVSAYRREGAADAQRSSPLEELKEVEDETDEFSAHSYMRNFRTFSTGHLELGRLKISRRAQHLHKDKELNESCILPENGQSKVIENGALVHKKAEDVAESDRLKRDAEHGEICSTAAANGENTGIQKKILKTSRSTEEPVSTWSDETSEEPKGGRTPKESCISSLLAKGNGKSPKPAPETPPAKRHPSLLRRSFSFRHWTGGELIRIRALSKEKHHSSSGCIGRDGENSQPKLAWFCKHGFHQVWVHWEAKNLGCGWGPKQNWLCDWNGPQGEMKGKNRTLDNSDLLKLSDKSLMDKESFIRGTGSRSSGRNVNSFGSSAVSSQSEMGRPRRLAVPATGLSGRTAYWKSAKIRNELLAVQHRKC